VYLPADPLLRRHASEVESELRHALRRPEDGEGMEEERAERHRSEPSPSAEFVPLSAEFAPQMTLFGPSPAGFGDSTVAPTATGSHTATPTSAAQPPPEPAPMAAFERRAYLRAERSRLVADLHRRDGRSHREINSWLNREVGIVRVDDATIDQLERSVKRLVKELTRRSSRAVSRT
jgi:hypothetical protein